MREPPRGGCLLRAVTLRFHSTGGKYVGQPRTLYVQASVAF